MRKLRIQGSTDKIYDVVDDEGSWTCPCSGFAANKFCVHVSKAKDFLDNNFGVNRGNLFSAFQKEVRRCDIHLGMTWAHILKKFCTDKEVKDFYLSICFEETRNLNLYNMIYNSWRDKGQLAIAELLLRSVKRWHSKHDWLPCMVEGYLTQASEGVFAEDKLRRVVLNGTKLADLYACAFSIFRSDEKSKLIRAFLEALQNRMYSSARIPNRQEVKFLSSVQLGFHELLTLCEMAMGYWDVSANDYFPIDKPYSKPNFIPRFEDYIHDNATSTGKDRLYKKWFDVHFGKKQPDNVDLRWSGLAPGVLWRYFAAKNNPDISNVPWDAVKIDDNDIVYNYKRVDACMHKMFYGTTHFCHAFDNKLDEDPFFVQVVKDNGEHEDLVRPYDFFGPKR